MVLKEVFTAAQGQKTRSRPPVGTNEWANQRKEREGGGVGGASGKDRFHASAAIKRLL